MQHMTAVILIANGALLTGMASAVGLLVRSRGAQRGIASESA